jgi:hypothetical protein
MEDLAYKHEMFIKTDGYIDTQNIDKIFIYVLPSSSNEAVQSRNEKL